MGHIQVELVSNFLMKLFSNLVCYIAVQINSKATKKGNQQSPLQKVSVEILTRSHSRAI